MLKDPKPTRAKIHEAQQQVQNIATNAEEKSPVVVAINEAILIEELKLANLRSLLEDYLKQSLEVVNAARNDLEAILGD